MEHEITARGRTKEEWRREDGQREKSIKKGAQAEKKRGKREWGRIEQAKKRRLRKRKQREWRGRVRGQKRD